MTEAGRGETGNMEIVKMRDREWEQKETGTQGVGETGSREKGRLRLEAGIL